MASDDTVYCLCRQSYDGNGFMIECDVCKDWFHGNCVGIQEHQASDIEIYHCPNCQVEHGPLVLKKRRNWHRHDYSETDETVVSAVQTGTFVFVQELKARAFAGSEDMPLLRLHGSELTVDYFDQNGFDTPIMVDKKDGLDLKVPPPNFSIQDVELYVGSMREIDVIDVSRQEDVKMLMREWTEYYNSPNRSKILNVISLEFSTTRLAEFVEPPRVVKEMSWVHQFWPDNIQDGEEVQFVRPEVQRYCLMGIKDSFTDFHVDFGGTSVWYHVLRGEKVFYMIRPTPENLALYERWISSSAQSETFFGDQVDICYKCRVKTGQTMFIPTGWIHAVLTPIDSLVFGGNFLHSYNMDLQIQIHEIEKRVKTPDKYLFPNYETVHWYAAKNVYDTIKDANEEKLPIAEHIANGAKALAASLKNWTSKKDFCKRDTVPETLQYNKLLKDLNREIKNLQQRGIQTKGKKPDLKKQQKNKKKEETTPMPFPSKLTMDVQGEGFSKISFGKVDMSVIEKPQMSDLDALLNLQTPAGGATSQEHASAAAQETLGGSLKVRIPKPGAYMLEQNREENKDISVYDFKDDFDDANSAPPAKSPIRSPLAKMLKIPPHTLSTTTLPASFKLKVSNVNLQGSKMPVSSLVPNQAPDGSNSTSFKAPPVGLPTTVKVESDSEEDDNLVVDERPPTKKQRRDSTGKATTGSLKLRLSTKDLEGGAGAGGEAAGAGGPGGGPGGDDPRSMASPEQRANIPTIRGGLNCSIADILEASGYGTETDFKIDEDMGRASPSMRDAIQGMLSMSRMGGLQLGTDVFDIKPKTPLRTPLEQKLPPKRSANDEETIDKMPSCYKDEEYVYPTLDLSESEDEHVFKPRGRIKKDETWNPKAKLSPNCPKPERPQREGVRRESVESGLAAAAARLASQPTPKRQYIRKKPKPPKLEEVRPGTSFSSTSPTSAFPTGSKKPSVSVTSPTAKKPKKGMATTKQRLSKILKIKF